MTRSRYDLVYLIGACLVLPMTSSAEGFQVTPQASLSMRSDAWSGSRQRDYITGIAQVSAWASGKLRVEDYGVLAFDGWARGQTKLQEGPDDAISPTARVRELYWRQGLGGFDLKLGRLMTAWGRADGINPTDKLSAKDFTLLVPDDTDQRSGNDGMEIGKDTTVGRFSWLWFAHAVTDIIPLTLNRPGVRYRVEHPSRKPQWGFKWDANGEGMDGSLSYFEGFDPNPSIRLDQVSITGVTIGLFHQPIRMLGADISINRMGAIWRGEIAATRPMDQFDNPYFRSKPQVFAVFGGEFTPVARTTLSLQAVAKRVYGFESPDALADPIQREVAWSQAANSGQTAGFQKGLTLRYASHWFNDTLALEASGLILWPSRNGTWRTRLNYSVTDQCSLLLGTDAFFGKQDTSFGQLRSNRLWYLQIRYSV